MEDLSSFDLWQRPDNAAIFPYNLPLSNYKFLEVKFEVENENKFKAIKIKFTRLKKINTLHTNFFLNGRNSAIIDHNYTS